MGGGGGVRSAFPRGATTAVHVRLHVVQHVRQSVLDHRAPAHVTHLEDRAEKEKTKWQVINQQKCRESAAEVIRLMLCATRG